MTTGINPPIHSGNYTGAAIVTKSDADELPIYARALYVGGTGNINLITRDGQTVLFSTIPAGTIIPIQVKQVLSTSTTATTIVALW